MGPFELIDLIGLDVNLSVARSFYAQGGEPERWRPSPIQEGLVAAGRLGRKSGQRLLRLRRRHPHREPDPDLGHRGARPSTRRSWRRSTRPPPTILPRLFAQIANEAAFALEEEVGSPADMDTAMRLGFNWPRGPAGADRADRRRARRRPCSKSCAAEHGEAYRPAPRLLAAGDELATAGEPRGDFEEARRGLVAPFDPPRVEDEDGRVVWELESYDFLDGEPPATANPSLWRQAQLCRIAGLFELAPGFYQLRGFDLSNMHVVEGDDGIVVIDPLVSAETAAAALALYREHRGDRPVTGLIYTHSHVDHFGGAKGIVSAEEIEAGRIPILAPAGFLHHAVSENVFAGTAMGRRAGYMYGALLERGPDGQIGSGLGQTTSLGTITLIPPNLDVVETGQEEIVDGVRMSFQLTPGTEAPAEMNIHFPDARVLCIADNAARSMHNILTPRGALVRDPRVWAHYLDEAIELFGADSDVLFAGHHWPCWGSEQIVDYLEKQRDLYTYLHDQTLRLLNQGHTGPRDRRADRAAAEPRRGVALPRVLRLDQPQHEGDLPALHGLVRRQPRPPLGAPAGRAGAPLRRVHGRRRGGAGEGARQSFEAGDYRWVAEVVNHVVFAEPENRAARELQADALEQLGYGAENASWRNFFLMGAKELREGISGTPTATAPPDVLAQLTVSQLLDAMAIRLNGPRAAEQHLRIDWRVTDPDEQHAITVRNGVLRHRPGSHEPRRRRHPRGRARGPEPAPAQNRRDRRARRERPPAGRGRRRQAGRAARPARRARPRLRHRHPGLESAPRARRQTQQEETCKQWDEERGRPAPSRLRRHPPPALASTARAPTASTGATRRQQISDAPADRKRRAARTCRSTGGIRGRSHGTWRSTPPPARSTG